MVVNEDTSYAYYPIALFFKEQIDFVNLRDFVITKTTIEGSTIQKDTINKDAFTAILTYYKNLSDRWYRNRRQYKETTFEDLGTESITVNYQTSQDSLPIQRIDILLSTKTKNVKKLFLRLIEKSGNDTTITQGNFSADKKLELATEYVGIGKAANRKMVTVEWFKPSKL